MLIFIFITATLHLWGEYHGRSWLIYVFKPFTVLQIIFYTIFVTPTFGIQYQVLILSGLVFSFFGDLFLMLPKDRFIQGLASFLVAHLFYIAAFSVNINTFSISGALPFIIAFLVLLSCLWTSLEKLKFPVSFYQLK